MRLHPRFLLFLLCLVVCSATAGSQTQRIVNLRPRTTATQPGLPDVHVTVDRRRVPLGTQVTFNLAPASITNDPRYTVTLYFGDGETQVMRQSEAVHVYPAVGTYTYAVDVKRSSKTDDDPTKRPKVTLNASPVPAKETETVKFSAQLSSPYPNIQYRFVYGDGSSSSWQASPQSDHSYKRAGNYSAYVDISDSKSRIGGSSRKQVTVNSGEKLIVSLAATPLPAPSGKPITFTASTSPARAGTRYRFNFGDGRQSSWQTNPFAQHTYTSAGRYPAYVQVSQFLNNQSTTMSPVLNVRSVADQTPDPRPSPSVQPTPDPSPAPTPAESPTPFGSPTPDGSQSPNDSTSPSSSPTGSDGTTSNVTGTASPSSNDPATAPGIFAPRSTWWYLLIAALILFLIYKASGVLFAAQPTFAPYPDSGVGAVAHEKGLVPLDFHMVLEPNVSGGAYSVSTTEPRLVRNAPEAADRQTFEI
jgi:hypothetical protein